jgi:hypothetical protein
VQPNLRSSDGQEGQNVVIDLRWGDGETDGIIGPPPIWPGGNATAVNPTLPPVVQLV